MKASFRNEFVRPAVAAVAVAGHGFHDQAEQEQQEGGDEKPEGESDSDEEEEEEEEESEPDPEKDKEKEAEAQAPTRLQKILGAVQSKAALLSGKEAAEAKVVELQGLLAASKGREASLSAELDQLKGEFSQIEQALVTSQEEATAEKVKNKGVEAKAAEVVAGLGVKTEDLPAAEREDESYDALHARMSAAKDPKEKYRLAQQVKAKRFAENN